MSEVVARKEDTLPMLLRKIRLATILGTYQSSLTNFPYISKEWKEHCDKERLLGVSITGQWDCPEGRKPETLRKLKAEAVRINRIFAKRFGVSESTAITAVGLPAPFPKWWTFTSRYCIRAILLIIFAVSALPLPIRFQNAPRPRRALSSEVGQSAENATTYVWNFRSRRRAVQFSATICPR